MITYLNSAIVRIRTADDRVVGSGFLVSQHKVLTCAHVVAQALGIRGDMAQTSPKGEVLLDFPLIAPEKRLAARVTLWRPAEPSGPDIAGLELLGESPADAQPVCLVKADESWGHTFRAFGFPSGYEDGVWTSGVLRERTAAGWVQVEDVKEPGYWIQPGFSGTPVWDEQIVGVVGMAVAADTDRVTKAAFMIPAQALVETWPEIAPYSLEAGSREHLQMHLTRLERAQRQAVDPSRFQSQIDTLREEIVAWDERVERQRERIAKGLAEQRQQMVEERARRSDRERLQIVGRPPLDTVDYFKNRQREQKMIGRLLVEPATRLVSVIGHGGIGKTALACKVLRDLERHRWPYADEDMPIDGIVYLSTRTVGISLERLFLDCAKLLDGEMQGNLNAVWANPQIESADKIARLLEALSDGHYVILLDNLDDLLDGQGRLTDDDLRLFFDQVLSTTCGAQLVITSRIALAFRREVMRFDRQVNLLEGLPIKDGVTLLRELDPNGDYGLRDAPEKNLVKAVEFAHGVPRALEVLAGILANDPFASLVGVLETFYEQEDVVQALIEENYKRLDQDARRVIEALAVFRRPVPPLAVDYLLEPFAPGLDVPGIVRQLTRASIVSVDRAAKTVTLHPIDQDYAYNQLPEKGETKTNYTRKALERRAADYYVQLRTPEETWKSIDDLEPQLSEFEHRVRAEDYDNAARLIIETDPKYLLRWGYARRIVLMGKQLEGKMQDELLENKILGNQGRAYAHLGHYENAVRYYKKALSIARRIGDKVGESRHLGYLGRAYRNLEEYNNSVDCHQQALSIVREMKDNDGESINLCNLGITFRNMGQHDEATACLKEALEISRQTGNRHLEGRALMNLGKTVMETGLTEQALAFQEQALDILREIGYRREEGDTLCSLGWVYENLGQPQGAIDCYNRGLVIMREIGDRRGEANNLLSLGGCLLRLGQLQIAIEHLSQAREIAEEVGKLSTSHFANRYIAQAYLKSGHLEDALDTIVLTLTQNLPLYNDRAAVLHGIILARIGQFEDAQGAFETARRFATESLQRTPNYFRASYTLGLALLGLALLSSGQAQNEFMRQARDAYEAAKATCGDRGVLADALRQLDELRPLDRSDILNTIAELIERPSQ